MSPLILLGTNVPAVISRCSDLRSLARHDGLTAATVPLVCVNYGTEKRRTLGIYTCGVVF